MRGEIYNIDDKKIFAFGGASCHDIPEGILNIEMKKKSKNMIIDMQGTK